MIKWEEKSYGFLYGYKEEKINGVGYWMKKYTISYYLVFKSYSKIIIRESFSDGGWKTIDKYKTNIFYTDISNHNNEFKIAKHKVLCIERKRKIKKFFKK